MIQSVLGEERDGEQAEQKRCMHETLGDKRDTESLSRSLYAKAKILWSAQPWMGHLGHIFPPQHSAIIAKEVNDYSKQNFCFLFSDTQGSCICEHTAVVTAHTDLSKIKSDKIPG